MKRLLIACLTILASTELGAQDRDAAGRTSIPMTDGKDHKLEVWTGAILNRADSFHVGRRYDGACHWAQIPWTNPSPGTSSYLAEIRNKDCFGVIYNVTVSASGAQGAPNDRVPSQPTKPYGVPLRDDDYVMQPSENVVEMEAFTVPRGPNGRCDWDRAQTRRKQHPITESSHQGERHARTCNGVMYFYAIPKEYQIGGDSTKPGPGRSVSIAFPPSLWEGPDTLKGRGREARDIVNLVLPRLRPGAKVAALTIEDETHAWVRTMTSPTAGIEYLVDKKNGRWVLTSTERVLNYRPLPAK